MTTLISAQLIVGASVCSVMDSSPLPRLTRLLLDLNGLSVVMENVWHA